MLTLMARNDQEFHAVKFDGDIYDCGSKLGFLMANVAYGLANDELRDEFQEQIKLLMS